MRISDWSSDVCSSDLIGKVLPARRWRGRVRRKSARFPFPSGIRPLRLLNFIGSHSGEVIISLVEFTHMVKAEPAPCAWRSEEHTSELQSLMRISYAVFCLKKQTKKLKKYTK